jgi:hypothetical protein
MLNYHIATMHLTSSNSVTASAEPTNATARPAAAVHASSSTTQTSEADGQALVSSVVTSRRVPPADARDPILNQTMVQASATNVTHTPLVAATSTSQAPPAVETTSTLQDTTTDAYQGKAIGHRYMSVEVNKLLDTCPLCYQIVDKDAQDTRKCWKCSQSYHLSCWDTRWPYDWSLAPGQPSCGPIGPDHACYYDS